MTITAIYSEAGHHQEEMPGCIRYNVAGVIFMDTVAIRQSAGIFGVITYDDEPPLTEEEISGIEVADKEIAEGKAIPFSEVFGDLW